VVNTILVTGATGHIGTHLISALAGSGHHVRAVLRDPDRAALPATVQVVRGDLSSPVTLRPALRDVDDVFLLWPGLPFDPAVVDTIAGHAKRVVYLSTNVTDLDDDATATSFHQQFERQIRQSGLRWTFLRPIDFATNTLAWADQIRQGVVRWPYGAAARSLIHERDIAEVAAHVLTTAGHDEEKYLLTGPRAITHAELAAIIGHQCGQRVRWEELAAENAFGQFATAWGSAEFAAARLAAWKSFVDSPEQVTDTVPRLLGRPARSFESWARDHAADFR
jgi:uncharacterized protein YbjT (DUF2867 family)